MASNDSKMSISARKGQKNRRFSAVAAVSLPFLRSSLINIIKATAISKLTAVTRKWLGRSSVCEWFGCSLAVLGVDGSSLLLKIIKMIKMKGRFNIELGTA